MDMKIPMNRACSPAKDTVTRRLPPQQGVGNSVPAHDAMTPVSSNWSRKRGRRDETSSDEAQDEEPSTPTPRPERKRPLLSAIKTEFDEQRSFKTEDQTSSPAEEPSALIDAQNREIPSNVLKVSDLLCTATAENPWATAPVRSAPTANIAAVAAAAQLEQQRALHHVSQHASQQASQQVPRQTPRQTPLQRFKGRMDQCAQQVAAQQLQQQAEAHEKRVHELKGAYYDLHDDSSSSWSERAKKADTFWGDMLQRQNLVYQEHAKLVWESYQHRLDCEHAILREANGRLRDRIEWLERRGDSLQEASEKRAQKRREREEREWNMPYSSDDQ